ncbi:hypothetical protein MA16_Dca015028 [Dendrobium catenatum]|uniref:Uncharacterized protein n=1 Tax=Dendrobium catenatum TaxID=906689 RepID=A0A2I0VDU6_9ASPA|nr:hypothetical protein MA16_Dca015028 [Dendrobium catenatum]
MRRALASRHWFQSRQGPSPWTAASSLSDLGRTSRTQGLPSLVPVSTRSRGAADERWADLDDLEVSSFNHGCSWEKTVIPMLRSAAIFSCAVLVFLKINIIGISCEPYPSIVSYKNEPVHPNPLRVYRRRRGGAAGPGEPGGGSAEPREQGGKATVGPLGPPI